jgi:hypothetical protein
VIFVAVLRRSLAFPQIRLALRRGDKAQDKLRWVGYVLDTY